MSFCLLIPSNDELNWYLFHLLSFFYLNPVYHYQLHKSHNHNQMMEILNQFKSSAHSTPVTLDSALNFSLQTALNVQDEAWYYAKFILCPDSKSLASKIYFILLNLFDFDLVSYDLAPILFLWLNSCHPLQIFWSLFNFKFFAIPLNILD